MKEKSPGRNGIGLLSLATMLLAACGTPPAKDFGGTWHPVNRYRSAPTEIPLRVQYMFFAAPTDETLKSMLSRWANDTDRTLDYQLSYDVTLYKPVATIRTADLDAAATELNEIYAAQSVRISAGPGEIVVQSNSALSPLSSPPSVDAAKTEAVKP